MDTLSRKPSAIEELAKQEAPPLALITSPPADANERDDTGRQMWTGLVLRFENGLSEHDRELWLNPPAEVGASPAHLRVMHAFDDFLLHQFAEFGWLLLMSVSVLKRIAEWQKHAPHLLERLGKELALMSRVSRSEKSAPLPEDIDVFADDASEELQRLLRRQREEFCSKRGVPSCAEIAVWMKSEIQSQPAQFPLLNANLAALVGWVETLPGRNKNAARTLCCGQMGVSAFFHSWYACCMNRSVKDLRNIISRLRARR